MSIRKVMKGVTVDYVAANGLMHQDHEALNDCQRQCIDRTALTIQLEQEAYLSQHPEIFAMMELFISDQCRKMKKHCNMFKQSGQFFLQPFEVLDEAVRKRLGVGPNESYVKNDKNVLKVCDNNKLEDDLKAILALHNPPKTWSLTATSEEIPNTESSSFLSAITSDTTLPTPEPEQPPEVTLSEYLMIIVSNTVDKAIYTRFDDQAVLYDSAYVEVSRAVEESMEIPVIEIKEDIAELFFDAFKTFEIIMDEKQRIIDEIRWEKRMRKKMKRTVRRQNNFKGYESPESSSSMSSHDSYRRPPPRPCACHPYWHFNRIPKDRFGIYLPRETQYPPENATVTPELSVESLAEEAKEEEDEDAKSASTRTSTTKSSKVSKGVKFN